MFRIGTGYDVHRLVSGRPLILGGVRIEHPAGLEGHSDADALFHAVADALLGAAALGDLGKHFPPGDPQFAGADSGDLLNRVMTMLSEAGYSPVNVDSTIIAQKPKLAPYIEAMRANLASHLGLALTQVSIKATTTEGLGAIGREEGIGAQAIVLIKGSTT